MRIAHSGRARISIRRPRALGESDRSGFWYSHADMVRQFQFAGNGLIDTGLLVGPDEVDKPQDQFRAPILPPDPIPVVNPRPSPNITGIPIIGQPLPTSPGNLGFSQYVLGASSTPLYPGLKPLVLSTAATYSGISTPGLVIDRSTVIAAGNRSQLLMQQQPARSWLLLFNPSYGQVQVALGTSVTWGTNGLGGNLVIGPGEAYFWSTSQGLGAAYTGSLAVIGLLPGVPFWAWESAGSTLLATDQYGNLITDDLNQWIATDLPGRQTNFQFYNNNGVLGFVAGGSGPWQGSAINLPAGSVWNNALTPTVVSGVTPNPFAQPVYFGRISPDELHAMGGGNLPRNRPHRGSQILWNMNGPIGIA